MHRRSGVDDAIVRRLRSSNVMNQSCDTISLMVEKRLKQ